MHRLFGMMPTSEVVIQKIYRDAIDLRIIVEAGPHGYTVIYADGSTKYKDIDDTPENNFKRALELLKDFEPLTEEQPAYEEICKDETGRS